jgi:NAD+ diphosphatase
MLTPVIEQEIADLGQRFGQPLRREVTLHGEPFEPLMKSDRYGEVCMVIRRKNAKLLTAIKTFYPPQGCRLLTGGIDHGEQIEHALFREVAEETGLDVVVTRFLAVIEYRLPLEDRELDFVTLAFLLDEQGGELVVSDPDERIGEFREISVDQLLDFARDLNSIPQSGYDKEAGGDWADWGRFRAVVHEVVYEALRDER